MNSIVMNEINRDQNIKFFSLGGIGEFGKNMYVCSVDERIFILDAGSKYPTEDLLGVDRVYPNIDYLVENSKNIYGVFLSHSHEENIGATIELLKRFDVGVFGSHFTISVLENKIRDAGMDHKKFRLYKISDSKVLKFGNITVEPYCVSHSVPETYNYAICTKSGIVIYAPDFSFNISNDYKYRINFDKISDFARRGVLMLAACSMGIYNEGTHSNAILENNVSQLMMRGRRVFISMYSTDLDKIQRVLNICEQCNRKVALIGRKTQKIISTAIGVGYLSVKEGTIVTLKFRNEEIKNNDKDLVIIALGERHEPFYAIMRMCWGQDKLVRIVKNDEVLFIAPPARGCSTIAKNCIDEILRVGAKYYILNQDEIRSEYPDREEIKMLYNMLRPKYVVPINGELRHIAEHKKLAIAHFMNKKNVIAVGNGDVLSFVNGEFKGVIDHVKCGDVFVDGALIGDVNELVLTDRRVLGENGIIVISGLVNKAKGIIYDELKVETTGVVRDSEDKALNSIKDDALEFLNGYFKLDESEIVSSCNEMLREYLMKKMFASSPKRPLIIPCILEIDD